jgi:hypothetical protein
MPFAYQLDVRAEAFYRGLSPENLDPERVRRAIEDAVERVEEWSYEHDAHGYCHDRTEVERLRGLLAEKETSETNAYAVGWAAARAALERESVAWQERGDTTRWATLAVGADTLRRLEERPGLVAPEEEDVTGLIDVETADGVQRWTLTCSGHGRIGHYPMAPILGQSEPELAWWRHIAGQHE